MTWFFVVFPTSLMAVIWFAFFVRDARAGRIVIAVFAAHAALLLVLGRAGVFERFEAMPPRVPIAAMLTIGLGVLVARLPFVREALRAMPAWWPIALQTFRAPLELALYLLFLDGLMPEQMTFTGRNFDVLVGLSAPVVAWLVATRRIGNRGVLVWNLASIGLLINVASIAIRSVPGPLNAGWSGAPLTIVGSWPFVSLPALLVPLAALGHIASLATLSRTER